MFLKELDLVGFKSFPEKTTLKFDPGITAIVGPNGCGKSNIFDGICWVLGEQSIKALRGTKMEDVIFNGTDKQASLGMAEVSLIFSNKSRKLSVDSDEIQISRRIFRSGESQYLLNKAPVRLKDISDLFMGTGIGAESYSLVQQGKIDLLLSTRPEERRLIFDEASGITKYKSQKKEASRKLEETEQNLTRINDIVGEVRREINSLERQVKKARRYKETFEELKNKEVTLAALDSYDVINQKKELLDKINVVQEDINSFEKENHDVQEGLSLRLNRIHELEKEIADYHDKLINIDNLINNNLQRIQIDEERFVELNERIHNLKEQFQEAGAHIETARMNLENFQNEYGEFKDILKQKETQLLKKQEEYDGANLFIKSSQEKISLTKNQILGLTASDSRIRNEIADLQAHLRSHNLRKKRLDVERLKTKEEKENLEGLINQHISELDTLNSEINRLKIGVEEAGRQRDFELSAQEALNKDIQALGNENIALHSQREFLQELKLKYEGISQSLNAVMFLDKLPPDNISGIIVKVKESPCSIEREGNNIPDTMNFKLIGEAKPMPLETHEIDRRITQIQAEIEKKQAEQKVIQL
ncbi:MAG: AAA family ATPase, partial [Candidatus Omnitrophota bacterium]